MNEDQLLTEMRQACKDGLLMDLTLNAVKMLKGKRIQTLYFGYDGQDGVEDFIVGEVITELEHILSFNPTYINKYSANDSQNPANTFRLMQQGGRSTFLKLHPENMVYNAVFTCSDSDRFVYYRIAKTKDDAATTS